MCDRLPNWIRRPFWAVVRLVRPSAAANEPEVVDAIQEREQEEQAAAERSAQLAQQARERRFDEERIDRSIRAISAEVRSRRLQ